MRSILLLLLAGVPLVAAEPSPPSSGSVPSKIMEGSPGGGLPYRLTMATDATEASPKWCNHLPLATDQIT